MFQTIPNFQSKIKLKSSKNQICKDCIYFIVIIFIWFKQLFLILFTSLFLSVQCKCCPLGSGSCLALCVCVSSIFNAASGSVAWHLAWPTPPCGQLRHTQHMNHTRTTLLQRGGGIFLIIYIVLLLLQIFICRKVVVARQLVGHVCCLIFVVFRLSPWFNCGLKW